MTISWRWIAAFAVFVACIPLFAWKHQFFSDWPNHLAMIGYFVMAMLYHGPGGWRGWRKRLVPAYGRSAGDAAAEFAAIRRTKSIASRFGS